MDFSALAGQDVRVVATDATGKVVMVKSIANVTGQVERFEIANHAAGLYLIRVETATGTFSGRLAITQ